MKEKEEEEAKKAKKSYVMKKEESSVSFSSNAKHGKEKSSENISFRH